MPEPELFLLFVRPLNRAGIRYVVTGSIAAILYGEPRLTHDVVPGTKKGWLHYYSETIGSLDLPIWEPPSAGSS